MGSSSPSGGRGARRAARRRAKLKAFDFCCGAGGLTRGLLDAGVDVVCGVDNDERLRDTYEANNAPSQFEHADIRELDIKALRTKYGVRRGDRVVYAACTPCQPFSSLTQARREDPRKDLLVEFGRLVRDAPPDFVVVENVPGLGNAYGREVFAQFVDALHAAGLTHLDHRELDAQDYGVPQIRKRYLLVASRHGPISLPAPDNGPPKTVRSVLERLPSIGSPDAPSNHVGRQPRPQHMRILEQVPPDGGSRADVKDESVLLKCHRGKPTVHRDVFGRMWWDRPAPTLTCRCTDVYCGRFAHPVENRGLTLREAAAIQTFRDDYEFHGTLFHVAAQIGNAVPVRLAERLGDVVVAAATRV